MRPWELRPQEEAALINPAFTSLMVAGCAGGYASAGHDSMPLSLVYLALPVLLHGPTRRALPFSVRTSLPAWLTENAEMRVGFGARVRALRSHAREGVLVGTRHGLLEMGGDGGILSALPETVHGRCVRRLSGDAAECLRRSWFLGKWFGMAGTPATVFALWGIRP